MYCLYHANCYDGFGAAHIVWDEFDNRDKMEGELTNVYMAVQYGQPCPLFSKEIDLRKNEPVFIVDFSYDIETLDELASMCKLTVLDHHKSVPDEVKSRPYFTFDNEESGATLTWKHFHPDRYVPLFYRYLRDRDLWINELQGTKEFTAALRSYPFDFELWNEFKDSFSITDGLSPLMKEGEAILRFTENQVNIICKNAVIMELGGYKNIPVVNSTIFLSEVPHQLCKLHPDAPFIYDDRGNIIKFTNKNLKRLNSNRRKK